MGITYYMHLNKNHRVYLKRAFVSHIILSGSHIEFSSDNRQDFSSSSHLLFGVGYNYRSLGLEFRYYTSQNITQNILNQGSYLTELSLKISYSFQLFGDKRIR